jgi:preprotein translocase subunit SecA
MGKIFKFLGMSVAVATDNMLNIERRVPFAADVTYVTAQVLCFTYLFDNTTQTKNYTVSCAFTADVTCVTAQLLCFMYLCDNTTQTKNYTVSLYLQQM